MKNNKLSRVVAACVAMMLMTSMVSCGDKKDDTAERSSKSTTASASAGSENNAGFTQEAVPSSTSSSSGEDSDMPAFMQNAELRVLKKYTLNKDEYQWTPNKFFTDSDYSDTVTVIDFALYFPNAKSKVTAKACHTSGEEYSEVSDICELGHLNFSAELADGGSILVQQLRFNGDVNPEDIAFSCESFGSEYFTLLSDTSEVGTDYINTVLNEHKLAENAAGVGVIQWQGRDFLVNAFNNWGSGSSGRQFLSDNVTIDLFPLDCRFNEKPAESDIYFPSPEECGITGDFEIDHTKVTSGVHAPSDGDFSWDTSIEFSLNAMYDKDENDKEQGSRIEASLKDALSKYYIVLKDGDSEIKLSTSMGKD